MRKIIFILSLVLANINIAQAVDWGTDGTLTDAQRPGRSWMSNFSVVANVIAGSSLSDGIASCDSVVGIGNYCVIQVAQSPSDLPLLITRSKTKLQGVPGIVLQSSGNGAFIQIGDGIHQIMIDGLELHGHQATELSGVLVDSQNSFDIAILNNKIHNFDGLNDAHGIAAYGRGLANSSGIQHLIIEGNEVYAMRTGSSESIVVNGNVRNWEIKGNYVHDINNIAVDAIGGEGTAPPQVIDGKIFPGEYDAARYGFIENNLIENMSTLSNPAYDSKRSWAAGIYVDGAHHVRIANNLVTNAPWAYEIGAENCITSAHVLLENNTALNSYFGDLVIGGYAVGGYKENTNINCDPNNTIDTNEGHGYVENIAIQDNMFSSVGIVDSTINLQFRVTHTLIDQGVTPINDNGNGTAVGDGNAIKLGDQNIDPPSSGYGVETPSEGSIQSGVGLIRGWACDALSIAISIDDGPLLPVGYGTSREDTRTICGDANNGYGMVMAWGLLGEGTHILKTVKDGIEIGNVTFEVASIGGTGFTRGLSGTYELNNFPAPGENVTVRWSEPDQNFIIIDKQ